MRENSTARHDAGFDVSIDGIELFARGVAVVEEPLAEAGDRAADLPGVQLFLRAIGAGQRIAFVMADDAVGLGFDQRGAVAGASLGHGLASGFPNGPHVVAIDRHAFDAVGSRFRGDFGIERGHCQRCGRGVEIIFAHEHDRQLLHAGQVDRFVKGAVIHRTIAKKSHRHLVGAARARAQAQADRGRQPAADEAIRAEQARVELIEVHAAASAAAAAARAAIELGQHFLRRHPLGQRVAVAAVGAGHPVVAPQVGTNADGRGFFADVEVDEARHLALAVDVLGRELEAAN